MSLSLCVKGGCYDGAWGAVVPAALCLGFTTTTNYCEVPKETDFLHHNSLPQILPKDKKMQLIYNENKFKKKSDILYTILLP
jgi:hypothetical protein